MIEIKISNRIKYQKHTAIAWDNCWYNVISELEESVGPFKSSGEYPIITEGWGWVIRSGVPSDEQDYYVIIKDERLALGYILKYVKDMDLVIK